MQTYTHMLAGAFIGASFFEGNLLAQAACAIGAVLPDVVQVPKYVLDLVQGRQPLAKVSPRIIRLKNAAHSIVIWVILFALALATGVPTIIALAAGGLSHPLIDCLTHSDEKYRHVEAGFLWPFPLKLAQYTGIWDYRIDHGVLRPKPLEAVVDIVLVIGTVVMWVT